MKRCLLAFAAAVLLTVSSLGAADHTAQLQQLFSALQQNFDKSKSPVFQTAGPLRGPTPMTQLRYAIDSQNSAQIESSLLLLEQARQLFVVPIMCLKEWGEAGYSKDQEKNHGCICNQIVGRV